MYELGSNMFFKSKRNIINTQVIKVKTDKISKRVVRDAKKSIRRKELLDARTLGMYLKQIDGKYDHIKADVNNATLVDDYTVVRAARIAETRQLLAFYDSSFEELRRLYKNLAERAGESGRATDLKNDITVPPDMNELKAAFRKITLEGPVEVSASAVPKDVKVRV